MTFPPIFLIDVRTTHSFLTNSPTRLQRVGRRPLLLASVVGALASLVLTGYGLNTGMVAVSSISVLIFVMRVFTYCALSLPLTRLSRSFAIGLGPVPFIIISEVAPSRVCPLISVIDVC